MHTLAPACYPDMGKKKNRQQIRRPNCTYPERYSVIRSGFSFTFAYLKRKIGRENNNFNTERSDVKYLRYYKYFFFLI